MNPEMDDVRLAIPTSDGYHFISLHELMYCVAEGNYSWLYFTNGRKYLVARTLKKIEGLLPQKLFIRIHSSYFINLLHVLQCNNGGMNVVLMSNGEELEVSRRNQKRLKEQFLLL